MTRPRAPKPAPGPIERHINSRRSPAARRNARVNAAFDGARNITSFSRGDMVVTVTQPPLIVGDHRGIRFIVSAEKNGVEQAIDPSRQIINPITKLGAGTWWTETIEGLAFELENMREHPQEATEEVLMDSILEHPR